MKESIWGYAVIVLGIIAIVIVWFFTNVTNTDQHNYNLLKESVEAAMYDSVDLTAYRKDGTIKIIKEKFLENFIRRFSENASLANTYKIDIYDINEEPPKVSLKVSSIKSTKINDRNGDTIDISFDVVNNIDAILETKFTSECTKEHPCYYWQDYVSWTGWGDTLLSTGTSGSTTAELKIPEPLSGYDIVSIESEDDVRFLGSASSPVDIKNYYEKRCDLLLWQGEPVSCSTPLAGYENYVDDLVTINSGRAVKTYEANSKSKEVGKYYKIDFEFNYECKLNNNDKVCQFIYKYMVKWKYYNE